MGSVGKAGKRIGFFLLLAVIISVGLFFLNPSGKGSRVTFAVSGIFQGNILPFNEKYGEYKGKNVGGLVYLSGLYKMFRKDAGTRYIFVDCGDNFSGTPEAYYTHGQAVITGLNALGLDAMSIGNREFDFGPADLRKNISDSNFTYLATNLKDTSRDRMEFEYVKIVNAGEFKVGILGIVPPKTPEMTEISNTTGFVFSEIEKSVPGYISFLREKGADVILVLSQLDLDVDLQAIDFLTSSGADIIQVLEYASGREKFQKIGKCYLVAHDGYAKGSNIQLFDARFDGGVLDCSNYRRFYIENETIKPDLELSEKLNEHVRKIDEIMNRVIGKIDRDYKNEYYAESGIGNFICDTIRKASGADVAIQNAGGIRADLKKGDFTIRMLHDVLPFDNEVILVRVKGEVLKRVFETVGGLKYGVLQVSGAEYTLDESKQAQLADLKIGGSALDLQKDYLVVVNSFLTGGGDGFEMLKTAEKIKVIGSLREIIKKQIESTGAFSADIDGRIKVLNR